MDHTGLWLSYISRKGRKILKKHWTGGKGYKAWLWFSYTIDQAGVIFRRNTGPNEHKGATNNPKLLKKLVKKDIRHGYGLVIPLNKLESLPSAILAPMNIMKQNKINEMGK
eukprot:13371615-Ditylum_brightwellii.AAC.1